MKKKVVAMFDGYSESVYIGEHESVNIGELKVNLSSGPSKQERTIKFVDVEVRSDPELTSKQIRDLPQLGDEWIDKDGMVDSTIHCKCITKVPFSIQKSELSWWTCKYDNL